MNTNIKSFTMVSNELLSSKLITVAEKEILVILRTFSNKEGECFPSVRKIADKLGCCIRKVRYTLKKLKDKCIIKVTPQYRKSDNSQTSNLYTIYDFDEIWQVKSVEEIKGVVEEYEEKKRIEAIEKLKGDINKSQPSPNKNKEILQEDIKPREDTNKEKNINTEKNFNTKEKEIENIAHQTKGNNDNQSQQTTIYSYNTTKGDSCQVKNQKKSVVMEEKYSMEYLKEYFNYNDIFLMYPKTSRELIDSIMSVIYDVVNNPTSDVRVNGINVPTEIVKSKIFKLDVFDICYVEEQYSKQTVRIYNQKSYITTILYNCKEQHSLDIHNQVNYDMANTDWSKLYKNKNDSWNNS